MNIRVHISLQICAFKFLGRIARRGIPGSYGNSILNFLRNLHTVFRRGCTSLHSHQQWMRAPSHPQPLQHLLLLVLLLVAILRGVRQYLIVVLIWVSLITSEAEFLFIYLLPICMSSWDRCLFRSSVHFLIGVFGVEFYEFSTYFDIKPLSEPLLANVISHLVRWLFVLLSVSFAVQKLFSLI